jgi:DNA-binding response OmpR family regulator
VSLSTREFALLGYLLRHRGQVLSRQQILDAVWGFAHEPRSNVVDVYVGYLRAKLDDREPSVIETVRGMGYRLAG